MKPYETFTPRQLQYFAQFFGDMTLELAKATNRIDVRLQAQAGKPYKDDFAVLLEARNTLNGLARECQDNAAFFSLQLERTENNHV
jgi:hypothetical protein